MASKKRRRAERRLKRELKRQEESRERKEKKEAAKQERRERQEREAKEADRQGGGTRGEQRRRGGREREEDEEDRVETVRLDSEGKVIERISETRGEQRQRQDIEARRATELDGGTRGETARREEVATRKREDDERQERFTTELNRRVDAILSAEGDADIFTEVSNAAREIAAENDLTLTDAGVNEFAEAVAAQAAAGDTVRLQAIPPGDIAEAIDEVTETIEAAPPGNTQAEFDAALNERLASLLANPEGRDVFSEAANITREVAAELGLELEPSDVTTFAKGIAENSAAGLSFSETEEVGAPDIEIRDSQGNRLVPVGDDEFIPADDFFALSPGVQRLLRELGAEEFNRRQQLAEGLDEQIERNEFLAAQESAADLGQERVGVFEPPTEFEGRDPRFVSLTDEPVLGEPGFLEGLSFIEDQPPSAETQRHIDIQEDFKERGYDISLTEAAELATVKELQTVGQEALITAQPLVRRDVDVDLGDPTEFGDRVREILSFGAIETLAANEDDMRARYRLLQEAYAGVYDRAVQEASKSGQQITQPKDKFLEDALVTEQEFVDRVASQAPDAVALASFVAKEVALNSVPILGQARQWDEAQNWERSLNFGLDILLLAPIVGQVSAGVRFGLTPLRSTANVGVALIKSPIKMVTNPVQALKAGFDPIAFVTNPKRIPVSGVEVSTGTVRFGLTPQELRSAGQIEEAMLARDELFSQAARGERTFATIGEGGRGVSIQATALNKVASPVVVHTTPDIRFALDGFRVENTREAGMFFAPNAHTRFSGSSAFGDVGSEGAQSGLIVIRDPEVLNMLEPTQKIFKRTIEIEGKIPEGVDIPAPDQFLKIQDASGNPITIAIVNGDAPPLTPVEVARLKIFGTADAVKQIFQPPTKLSAADQLLSEQLILSSDKVQLAKDFDGLISRGVPVDQAATTMRNKITSTIATETDDFKDLNQFVDQIERVDLQRRRDIVAIQSRRADELAGRLAIRIGFNSSQTIPAAFYTGEQDMEGAFGSLTDSPTGRLEVTPESLKPSVRPRVESVEPVARQPVAPFERPRVPTPTIKPKAPVRPPSDEAERVEAEAPRRPEIPPTEDIERLGVPEVERVETVTSDRPEPVDADRPKVEAIEPERPITPEPETDRPDVPTGEPSRTPPPPGDTPPPPPGRPPRDDPDRTPPPPPPGRPDITTPETPLPPPPAPPPGRPPGITPDRDTRRKPPREFRLPSGRVITDGRFPEVIGWQQGLFFKTLNLRTEKVTNEFTPDSANRDAETSFRVITFSSTAPEAKKLNMGVVDVIITTDGIDFKADRAVASAGRREAKREKTFKSRGM